MRVLIIDFCDTLFPTTQLLDTYGLMELPSTFSTALASLLSIALTVTDGNVFLVSCSSKGWIEGCVSRYLSPEVAQLVSRCQVRLVPEAHMRLLGPRRKEPTILSIVSECYVSSLQSPIYTPTSSKTLEHRPTLDINKSPCFLFDALEKNSNPMFDDSSELSVLLVGDMAEDLSPAERVQSVVPGSAVKTWKFLDAPNSDMLTEQQLQLALALAS
jgi:hypothetical protein